MLKKFINKIRFPNTYSSEVYINYLRKLGMKIGNDVIIYSPNRTIIDEQYPWMITIGEHVRITTGVIILTHDFSWSVLKNYNIGNGIGAILGASGKIKIGNNVFIGMNSVILRGSDIGDNVIIGAGSVVSGKCESNSVYAGNPARKISTLDNFYKKRERNQLKEAIELVQTYYKRFNKIPPKDILFEYFMLFEKYDNLSEKFRSQIKLGNTEKESIQYMKNLKCKFSNYNDFISYCLSDSEGR